jgi:hypothetical protein
MLKETVNNSISSKARHFEEEQIVGLFYKTGELDPVERYAVSVIFTEATLQEILMFLRKHHIPFSNAKALYRLFCHSRLAPKTKERGDKYEWFLG